MNWRRPLVALRLFEEDGTVSFTSLYLYAGILLCGMDLSAYSLLFVVLAFAMSVAEFVGDFKANAQLHQQALDVETLRRAKASDLDEIRNRLNKAENELRSISSANNISKLRRE